MQCCARTFALQHTRLNSLVNCSIIKSSLFSDLFRKCILATSAQRSSEIPTPSLQSQVPGQTCLVSLHQTYMLAISIQLSCTCAPNDIHWEQETHNLIQYSLQQKKKKKKTLIFQLKLKQKAASVSYPISSLAKHECLHLYSY